VAAELLIRPGRNDHLVLQDLLAPGGAAVLLPSNRPLVSRLVLDAHLALRRPDLSDAAAAAGTGVLIDPLTPLWQGDLRPEDPWSKLSFGVAERLSPSDFSTDRRDAVVASVVDFQLGHGATAIIPPYTYSQSPLDPWFEITLGFIRATARYMRHEGIHLPLVPVFCAQLKGFGRERTWRVGVDRFVHVALDVGPQLIALCLSPTGGPRDSYEKILRLFLAGRRLKSTGSRVVGWRQGIYGPALVAAGLDGYETGIGTREQSNLAGMISSRKPKPAGAKRRASGGLPGVYLEPLGRSVPSPIAETLLGSRAMRPKVMCDDERCCPDGAGSTLDHRAAHAVRTRARQLAELDAQPAPWRLHQIAKSARSAAGLAAQANRVLAEAGLKDRLHGEAMQALAQVAEFLGQSDSTLRAA
jgi:hypothetical protein